LKTYNQILDRIKTIADNHRQISTFGQGDVWEIATSGTINYPLFWVVTKGSRIRRGEIGYEFQFLAMDMVRKDEENENDVLNDTLQIITDMISKLKMGKFAGIDLKFSDEIKFESFTERFDEQVSGWLADLTVWTDWNWDSCAIPLKSAVSDVLELEGEEYILLE